MSYLFTSESVSEGHPDKIADQISDALLDNFLAFDPQAKVACETLVTTGQVVLTGEVRTKTYIDVRKITRDTLRKIGYNREDYCFHADSCGIFSAIHEQSPEITLAVSAQENLGAGDQGLMFGYATNENPSYMPTTLQIAHGIMERLAQLRHQGVLPYVRPDAKCQITIEYTPEHIPKSLKYIVLSTQHDPLSLSITALREKIEKDFRKHILPYVLEKVAPHTPLDTKDLTLIINPAGTFVTGGPHGDAGLTGRKIIVDTYGGFGAHGGGAFSGKDPSKVDRSAAYAARHIAKNVVAAGMAQKALVQVAYAIGMSQPISFSVNTQGTSLLKASDKEITEKLQELFPMQPAAIIQRLDLQQPLYAETAAYGHMGRTPQSITKHFQRLEEKKSVEVKLFPWEEVNYVEELRTLFF